MARHEREALSAIMEQDAGARCHRPAAVLAEKRIDEADGIAVAIDNAEIDGVAVLGTVENWQCINGPIADRMASERSRA
jgi:hypothetical protein